MKKLLILGAGFLQDFVIRKAVEMGIETYAVDGNPKSIGFTHAHKYAVISIVDQEACLKYALENKVDGVMTAATDYGVLTASYIAEHMGLPGLKYDVAKLIKNKYQVRKCLSENDVDGIGEAYEIDEDCDIFEMAKKLTYPVMIKPSDGSGSRGVSRGDLPIDIPEACKHAMSGSITGRAEIEPFITGKEYGAEALVINGVPHVFGIMKKWMTNPPCYAELGHALPNDLPRGVNDRAIACVEKVIRVLGINWGSVNIDMIIGKNGEINIVDIGARMGGNMIGPCIIPYGTGVDYMRAMIQNAIGEPVEFKKIKRSAVATKLLAFDEGVIKRLPDMNEVENIYGVEIYHHMSVGDHVNEYHTNLDGCGYIVARDADVSRAIEKAEKALEFFKNYIF